MARRSGSRRDRRQAPVHRRPLAEEDVEALRRDGLLSKVIRLPVVAGAPSVPIPPPGRYALPVLTAPTAAPAATLAAAPAPIQDHRHGHGHGNRYDLCLADGTRTRVTSAGLVVGRRRSSATASDPSSTPRLELGDESRSLSREHAQLVVDDQGVVRVTDLGSGNGTRVQRLGGTTVELVPGTPLVLTVGDVLHLGGTTASLQEARSSPEDAASPGSLGPPRPSRSARP
jgi:hypothetical protein